MKKSLECCAASNCESKKIAGCRETTFFSFPQDEGQCKNWCINMGRSDLLYEPISLLYKKYQLCSKHFSKSQFCNYVGTRSKRLRLLPTAIPSLLNVSSKNSVEKAMENEVALNRKAQEEELQQTVIINEQNIITTGAQGNNLQKDKRKSKSRKYIPTRRKIRGSKKQLETPTSAKSEDLHKTSELPYLEVYIHHDGYTRKFFSSSNKMTYKYRDSSGNMIDLDVKCPQGGSPLASDAEKDFIYEEGGRIITVKHFVIDEYRHLNGYYGPLKIITELPDTSQGTVDNEVISVHLEPLNFAVMNKDDRSLNDQELNNLMREAPNIIPSCNPPQGTTENGFTVFSKDNKKFNISNQALTTFREHTGCSDQLILKKVMFGTSDTKIDSTPFTLLHIGPRNSKTCSKILSIKKKKLLKSNNLNCKSKMNKALHSYTTNYVNWGQRGSVHFSNIKKVGISFIHELLTERNIQKTFPHNPPSPEIGEEPVNAVHESFYAKGTQEHTEELWLFLCSSIKDNSNLIDFFYDMEGEKWVEIKRAFNTFLINGESVPDIVLKLVAKPKSLTYYLRCIGRLISTGSLCSKRGISKILDLFTPEKYICVGLNKDKFINQVDENAMLRRYMEENVFLSTSLYDALHDWNCEAIVKDSEDLGNHKFSRGQKTICAPLVVCKPCKALFNKLLSLSEDTFNTRKSSSKEELTEPQSQRYAPLQSLKIGQNIRNLCTETVLEFVSGAQNEAEDLERFRLETEITSKLRSPDTDSDLSEDEIPGVMVTEKEFSSFVSIESSPDSSCQKGKRCEKCGFETQSMLTLFTHMSRHLSSVVEECTACGEKFSSRESLIEHQQQNHSDQLSVCSLCQHMVFTTDDYYYHMNSHRSSKAFVCGYCDHRHKTLETYKKHMKRTHRMETIKDMNFECKNCRKYFYTNDHLFIHRLNADHFDKSSIKCNICSYSCSTVSTFQSHILSHTYDQREYHNSAVCVECKQFFFSTYELDDHAKKSHGERQVVEHEISAKIAIDNDNVDKNSKWFTCLKCFRVYGSSYALEKHLEASHAEDNASEAPTPITPVVYEFPCSLCGLKFTSEYFLNTHMNLHSTNRSVFRCDELNYLDAKRAQPVDQIIRADHTKRSDKEQEMIQPQPQQQQLSSFGHHFQTAPPPTSAFPDGHVSRLPLAQSQVIPAPPSSEALWSQTGIFSGMEESPDTVYSLLHL